MQFRRLSSAAVAMSMTLLTACTATHDIRRDLALENDIQQLIERHRQQARHLELIRSHIRHLEMTADIESPAPSELSPPSPLSSEQLSTSVSKQSRTLDQTPTAPGGIKHSAASISQPQHRPDSIAYKMAFSALTNLRYADAESLFEHFLRTYRHHPQSPNARYWLANAQASLGKNDLAAANLRQVIVAPGAESKKPVAMLLLSQIYRRQGFDDKADELLTQRSNNYPAGQETPQLFHTDFNFGESNETRQKTGMHGDQMVFPFDPGDKFLLDAASGSINTSHGAQKNRR